MSAALQSGGAVGGRDPTAAERAMMERDGYFVVPGFFDARQTADLLRWTEALEQAPERPGQHWVYHEDSLTEPARRVIQRIENFCRYHQSFDDIVRNGALSRWTAALMGGPVVLFKDKINFKMPGGPGSRPIKTSKPAGRATPPFSSPRSLRSMPRRWRTAVWRWCPAGIGKG